MEKQDYFIPENKCNEEIRVSSPSGKYELLIEEYSTRKGCWGFSQGTVSSNGNVIAVVQRNYQHFPRLFIEGLNGHDYLVCGEDYQGQTVIELDTGKRRDYLPKGAEEGCGFCWASYNFNEKMKVLMVDGCYWGASYEFKFFDFSDPMNGWPEIEIEEHELHWGKSDSITDVDGFPPTIDDEGIITAPYYVEELDFVKKYPWVDIDSVSWFEKELDYKYAIVAVRKYKIEGKKIIFLGEEVSDIEKEARERAKIWKEEHDKWERDFRTNDPLYLEFVKCLNEIGYEGGFYIGYTYDGWCPGYKFDENRWGVRLTNSNGVVAEIEWGIKTGPIKVHVTVKGDKFFMEHSVESVRAAFEYVRALDFG